MTKRTLSLIALLLTVSLFFTVVAHACSDLSSVKAIVQTPCEHDSPQNEPRGKSEKHNCDSVRYAMLSTQASSVEPELSKFYSIAFEEAALAGFSLPVSLPALWRTHAPPFPGLAASPRLSHIVLRI
jgi:hypothetical protein